MNKKKILVSLSIVCIFILAFIIYNYINNDGVVIASGKSEEYVNDRTFSLMLETSKDSGEYQMSLESSWPDSDYEYNATLSSCENGSQLVWNEEKRTVTLKANISDKCYLYFDYNPKPTVTLATNNQNDTFNPSALATLSCSNATANYNQKYQRVEISEINNKNTACTLTYSKPLLKDYLNEKIIGLSGTTQGIGQVVNEQATITNYSNATKFGKSDYKNVTMYSSSFASSTSGTSNENSYTFSGDSWSSVPSNLTSNRYYHIKFGVAKNGYYQVCYTMSSGDDFGGLSVYKGTKQVEDTKYASTSIQTGCIDLGYVDINTDVRIVQRAFSSSSYPIATITFNLQQGSATFENAGIRYEGKNPNNYIWFNNELWRIIGVFDENSHGQNNQNLVKIIRNESLGGLAWNKTNVNDWTNSSLKNLLNNAYINSQNGTNGEFCYGSSKRQSNCDYTVIGIKNIYRPMIKNVRWYLGGSSIASITTNSFYVAERSNSVYSGRPTYWDGKIGLMYASDYGYSVLSSSCTRDTNLVFYDNSTCAGNSWMYNNGIEWTITPVSTFDDETMFLYYGGKLTYNTWYDRYVTSGYNVRPVLYLDSSVYLIGGNGSISNPYLIGM